jgi:hypothetical protein
MPCNMPSDHEKQNDPYASEYVKQPATNKIKTEHAARLNHAELEAPLSVFEGGETFVPVRDVAD